MNIEVKNLREENEELKRAMAILMNKELVKDLSDALKRVNSGDYVSEEEFFRDSPQ